MKKTPKEKRKKRRVSVNKKRSHQERVMSTSARKEGVGEKRGVEKAEKRKAYLFFIAANGKEANIIGDKKEVLERGKEKKRLLIKEEKGESIEHQIRCRQL